MRDVFKRVFEVLSGRKEMTEHLWDSIDDACMQLSAAEVRVLTAAFQEIVCTGSCSFPPLKDIDHADFARRFIDNGRWIDSLCRAESGTRRSCPASDIPILASPMWSGFRKKRHDDDARLWKTHAAAVMARYPNIQWDNLAATPQACAQVSVQGMDEPTRRACLHALRRTKSWRDAYDESVRREFAHISEFTHC